MYINYEHYRIFYYVAKCRSFTGAAKCLLSNQPNVTRTVKILEEELGCTLFVRSNRGVSLTPEGEKLYSRISIAIEQISLGEEELTLDKSLKSGSVSIGASEVALHCFLLPVLKEFHKHYPGIRIRVTNHTTPQAVAALNSGSVDLAMVTTPFDLPEHMRKTELKEFSEIAVCGAALSHLTDTPINLKELKKYPMIGLSPQTKTYELYTQIFLKYGLTYTPDIEVATADQILPMVKNDLGIGFIPKIMADEAIKKAEVFPLKLIEEIPLRRICVIKNLNRPSSVAAKALKKAILDSK